MCLLGTASATHVLPLHSLAPYPLSAMAWQRTSRHPPPCPCVCPCATRRLDNNNLGSSPAPLTSINDALATMSTLRTLTLSNNNFNDKAQLQRLGATATVSTLKLDNNRTMGALLLFLYVSKT